MIERTDLMEYILSKLAILPLAAGEDIISAATAAEKPSIIKSIIVVQCDPLVSITFKFINNTQDLSIKCSSDLFIDCCSIKTATVSAATHMLVEYTLGKCDI